MLTSGKGLDTAAANSLDTKHEMAIRVDGDHSGGKSSGRIHGVSGSPPKLFLPTFHAYNVVMEAHIQTARCS